MATRPMGGVVERPPLDDRLQRAGNGYQTPSLSAAKIRKVLHPPVEFAAKSTRHACDRL